MARYGQAYKDRVVARLLPPESVEVGEVSRAVGLSVTTLLRWRSDAVSAASGDRPGAGSPRWTAEARLDAVIATANMDDNARAAWCREHGLFMPELNGWRRDAVAGLGEPKTASSAAAREDRLRIKALERELNRKDKALAETAALLVFSKKLSAVFHMGADT